MQYRALVVVLVAVFAGFGCVDQAKLVKQLEQASGRGALSETDIALGLKEALRVGTERATAVLGREGGYLDDLSVRVLMPESLRKVERLARDLGQGRAADEFIASMNRAAEQAAPQAVAIFGQAIREMTLQDANNILRGSDDAATRYFRSHTEGRLTTAMLPVVQDATGRAGVTKAYKDLIKRAGPLAQLIDKDAVDLDRYVTAKALDGLFLKLAVEEKRIREDPVARTTELLRKVFASRS